MPDLAALTSPCVTCATCGEPFPATRSDRRYCTTRCKQAAYNTRHPSPNPHRPPYQTILAGHPSPDRLARTLIELRDDHHLSYSAISVILALYEGVDLTEGQVRSWARSLGVPPDVSRSRRAVGLVSSSNERSAP